MIANSLGLIELVRFRSHCKAWNSASSAASARIESALDFKPWFLLYGTGGEKLDSGQQCKLVADCGTKFNMSASLRILGLMLLIFDFSRLIFPRVLISSLNTFSMPNLCSTTFLLLTAQSFRKFS
ncbi:hypothetical protein FF1_037631 [Malus domestica]